MTLAIGRLEAGWSSGQTRSGTAFAISPTLALTALHCVRSLEAGEVSPDLVRLHFQDGFVDATVETGDVLADFAVLRLRGPLPAGALPVQIVAGCEPREQWYSMGYPVAVPDVDGYAFTGSVVNPTARIRVVDPVRDADGPGRWAPAIQLQCEQAAARLPMRGASGAPVLVGGTSLAVGIVRWNQELEEVADGEFLAAGGAVFACPTALAAAAHEEVGRLLVPAHRPQFGRDKDTEKALLDQLPVSRRGRLGGAVSGALVAGLVAILVLGTGGGVAASRALGDGGRADLATLEPAAGLTVSTTPTSTVRSTASATSGPSATSEPSAAATAIPGTAPTRSRRPSVTVGPPTGPPPSCPATISLSPSSGPVGTAITIRGSCFQPGEVVEVVFHTDVISQPVASARGSFSATGRAPAFYEAFAPKQYTVRATSKRSIQFSDRQPFQLTSSTSGGQVPPPVDTEPTTPPARPTATPTEPPMSTGGLDGG